MILERPSLYTAAGAVYKDSSTLRQAFTWTDRFEEEYRAYYQARGKLHLPRMACLMGEDRRSRGLKVQYKLDFAPRNAEQTRVVAEAIDVLDEDRGGFIFQASTGFGKSVLACPLIDYVGRKTLIVVPEADLIHGSEERPQWYETLRDRLGIPSERIGVWRADTVQVSGRDVVIGVLHSVAKPGRYDPELYKQFGLVIFDECHRVPAETFNLACYLIPAVHRIGLSATPERQDGRDKLLRAHLGKVAVQARLVPMRPKVLWYDTGWKVPKNRNGDPIPHSPGRDMHVLKLLAKDRPRNALIAKVAATCRAKDRNLVVFSHLVDHLELLYHACRAAGIKAGDMDFYVGGKTPEQLDRAAAKPVVLATYKMASTGTNCPWWDACILATPKGNVTQTIGRILRESPGKKTPVVIDLVDDDSYVYRIYADGRFKVYDGDEVRALEITEVEPPEV